MAISPLAPYSGTVPNKDTQTPLSFSAAADSFVAWLAAPLITMLSLFVDEANALQVDVNAKQVSSAESASTATLKAQESAASAQASASSSNTEVWVSGTTYAAGVCVFSPTTFQAYRRKVAGAGTTDPSADATNWQSVSQAVNADTTGSALSVKSNATAGLLQITGPAAGQTRVATVPNANFSVDYLARTGNVLQVVNIDCNSTTAITTSMSYIATGLTGSITPSSTTSKILIRVSGGMHVARTSTAAGSIALFENGVLKNVCELCFDWITTPGVDHWVIIPAVIEYCSSPNTTSSLTYSVYMKVSYSGTEIGFPAFNYEGSSRGQMILMEIAG